MPAYAITYRIWFVGAHGPLAWMTRAELCSALAAFSSNPPPSGAPLELRVDWRTGSRQPQLGETHSVYHYLEHFGCIPTAYPAPQASVQGPAFGALSPYQPRFDPYYEHAYKPGFYHDPFRERSYRTGIYGPGPQAALGIESRLPNPCPPGFYWDGSTCKKFWGHYPTD